MSPLKYLVFIVFTLFSSSLLAEIVVNNPDKNGLSSSQLKEMESYFSKLVSAKKVAGLSTLVAKDGKVVHFKTYGKQSIETGKPMAEDSIFRLYSMSKPVTGVAMMMLWEQGKFKLDDPVAKYLPEFKELQVYKGQKENGELQLVEPKRAPTIRDLMRHTSGLSYGFSQDNAVDKLYQQANIWHGSKSLKSFSENVAKLPLVNHPGDRWVYSVATDIQGRLVEVISGKAFNVFLLENIFQPLGMKDTNFKVSGKNTSRLVELYRHSEKNGLSPCRDAQCWDFTQDPGFYSGGGGLVGTAEDYWRFAQMLANGGEFNGTRILKATTVKMMAENQLAPEVNGMWSQGWSFGLNFAVVTDAKALDGYGNNSTYYWAGMANTLFWIDPVDDIVAILMVNILPEKGIELRKAMKKHVYSALAEAKS